MIREWLTNNKNKLKSYMTLFQLRLHCSIRSSVFVYKAWMQNRCDAQVWLIISWNLDISAQIFWSRSDVSLNVATTFLRTKLRINRLPLLLETHFLGQLFTWNKSLDIIWKSSRLRWISKNGDQGTLWCRTNMLRHYVWHLAITKVLTKCSQ